MSKLNESELMTLGWREWIALPALGLPRIKAKVDTGARSSALQALSIRRFNENGNERVEFRIYPNQRDRNKEMTCIADVVDERAVTDSGGHRESRLVISTPLEIGGQSWPIELTLTARSDMLFRMLIGRTAINNRAIVNPVRSYVQGKRIKQKA